MEERKEKPEVPPPASGPAAGVPRGPSAEGGSLFSAFRPAAQPAASPPASAQPHVDPQELKSVKEELEKLKAENKKISGELEKLRAGLTPQTENKEKTGPPPAETAAAAFAELEAKVARITGELAELSKKELAAGEQLSSVAETALKSEAAIVSLNSERGRFKAEFEKLTAETRAGLRCELDKFTEEIAAMQEKADGVFSRSESDFESLKNLLVALNGESQKKAWSVISIIKSKLEKLENEYNIVLRNKIMLLEAKYSLAETLARKLESMEHDIRDGAAAGDR